MDRQHYSRIIRHSLLMFALTFCMACEQPAEEQASTDSVQAREQPSQQQQGAAQKEKLAQQEAAQQQPDRQPSAQPTTPPSGKQAKPVEQEAESGVIARQQHTVTISDQQIEEFVEVSPRMQKIEQKFRAQMAKADSAEDAKKLQDRARQEMEKVFESTDLEPQQYAAIASKFSKEPKFRERVEKVTKSN